MAKKWFKWKVEIVVDRLWVEDGFDLTRDRLHNMMCRELPFAHGDEIKCKVVEKPLRRELREAWGEKLPRKRAKNKRGA